MDKEVNRLMEGQVTFRNDLDVLEDRVMDVEMSATGAHTMMAPLKEDVQDLNYTMANLSNQVESICVEDIAWCRSRISTLEKPNNPTNKSLWLLVNQLSRRVEDQQDQIATLQAGMIGMKERVGALEMSLSMIQSRVSVLEEAMEIDPPVTDLSGDDLMDLEYSDVDDGGAMMVEDLEDERENMAPPLPPVIQVATPHPAPVLWELIPIDNPAPLCPGVELKGEDDAWYIHWGRGVMY
jgi:archaellum component FlaC